MFSYNAWPFHLLLFTYWLHYRWWPNAKNKIIYNPWKFQQEFQKSLWILVIIHPHIDLSHLASSTRVAVICLKYCWYGVKHYSINQSINQSSKRIVKYSAVWLIWYRFIDLHLKNDGGVVRNALQYRIHLQGKTAFKIYILFQYSLPLLNIMAKTSQILAYHNFTYNETYIL